MKKISLLITLFAFTLISCTNKSEKQIDSDRADAIAEESVIDANTAQETLDWPGVYKGTLPCADCDGIETSINLKEDYTYVATYTYIGKPSQKNTFSYEGTFTFDGLGSTITLESATQTSQYRVGEKELILLDVMGDLNVGELNQEFILKKKM